MIIWLSAVIVVLTLWTIGDWHELRCKIRLLKDCEQALTDSKKARADLFDEVITLTEQLKDARKPKRLKRKPTKRAK